MLRGNYTARIDVKGRLKLPTSFRRLIEEKFGSEFYITSLTGDYVRIYPLPEWESIEQRPTSMCHIDLISRAFGSCPLGEGVATLKIFQREQI